MSTNIKNFRNKTKQRKRILASVPNGNLEISIQGQH